MAKTLTLLFVLLAGCRASGELPGAAPLGSVDHFDLERYLGKWYEVAKYPVPFEKGLVGVTAHYSMLDSGEVRVENAGRRVSSDGSFDGERKVANGKAWIPDADKPSRLKVSFFWPFSAPYWVIALDPEYRWSIVGEPGRRYPWILSRTPEMSPALYSQLVRKVEELGYDSSRLEKMPQSP